MNLEEMEPELRPYYERKKNKLGDGGAWAQGRRRTRRSGSGTTTLGLGDGDGDGGSLAVQLCQLGQEELGFLPTNKHFIL